MNVWKIDSRWSDDGNYDSSVLDVFRKYNIAFAGRNTDYIKNHVKKGDLVAVTDGITVVSVGEIEDEPKPVTEFTIEDKDKNKFDYEEAVIAFKVKLYNFKKEEEFDYTRGTFHKVHGIYEEKVKELLKKKDSNDILKKYKTKDVFSDKTKCLNSCIKQINIENYQAIKKLMFLKFP